MSDRAQALADKFGTAHDETVKTVEGIPDDRWSSACHDEERAVGVIANHIASSYESTFGIAQLGASGQPLPQVSWDMIHDRNAQHAAENGSCTKEETLALLREGGERTKSAIAAMSDEQLDQTLVLSLFGPDEMTVEQLIDGLVIGHIGMHLPSIKEPVA